ncbi:RNA polymerase sigma factor (sigma-70 family) [Nitrobacteraceae bacterium AZCC 1564]
MRDKDDKALFDEVFLPYLPEAFRLARSLTGNTSDAEDVVQDAAIRAFRGIHTFGAVNARAWSLTIVRNTAYSWLMKNRPKDVVFTDDLAVADRQNLGRENSDGTQVKTPEDIAILKATVEDVRDAIAALPALFREIIVLREMHELNYRDIARITNLPIGTVMSRLSRARQMLIETLGHSSS